MTDPGYHRAPALWEPSATPPEADRLDSSTLGPLLPALLARRGVRTDAGASRFLFPERMREQLYSTEGLAGVEAAADRVEMARARDELIVVVGDYDADGVSSTALLVASLRAFGLRVDSILPDRMSEGYGFRPAHVQRALELGSGVVLTVDCGTTSYEAIDAALEGGLSVIVVDHHLPGRPLPSPVILINPKQESCGYPFSDFAAAGLALKLVLALADRLERPLPLEALLRVACLGTIADVVPLRGENRAIAAMGLKALGSTRSVGLRALLRRAGVQEPVQAEDVGYRIAPRINAAGRLSTADLALELLLTRDRERGESLSKELDDLNRARQEEERRVVEEAAGRFETQDPLPPILVEWDSNWHRGVVGIAAGRLARRFHRPALLLAVEGEEATGSGRSIPEVDLFAFLNESRDRLVAFGGHTQAVGMTVSLDRLSILREDWIRQAASSWPEESLARRYEYELELKPEEVDTELLRVLDRLEPHGEGNRRPLVRVDGLKMTGEPRLFGTNHLKGLAQGPAGGPGLLLLGWRWQDRAVDLKGPFDALGYLELDRWSGRPVLRLEDARPSES